MTTRMMTTLSHNGAKGGRRKSCVSQGLEKFTSHCEQNVRTTLFSEIQLVLLTFCTGIQDATTFPDYHCFTSNQTGNTVFLCLTLVIPNLNGDMFMTPNIAVALGLFLGAGWLTGQLSHILGPRKRWWLILSNFIQTCLVFGAAAIQYKYGIQKKGPTALLAIGMLASASGSQVVQSRSLCVPEISTAMATAAWIDLVMDGHLLALKNRGRNRRIAFLLSLALGAFAGAGLYSRTGSATAIAVSGAGKLLVTIMYFFASCEKEHVGTEEGC